MLSVLKNAMRSHCIYQMQSVHIAECSKAKGKGWHWGKTALLKIGGLYNICSPFKTF